MRHGNNTKYSWNKRSIRPSLDCYIDFLYNKHLLILHTDVFWIKIMVALIFYGFSSHSRHYAWISKYHMQPIFQTHHFRIKKHFTNSTQMAIYVLYIYSAYMFHLHSYHFLCVLHWYGWKKGMGCQYCVLDQRHLCWQPKFVYTPQHPWNLCVYRCRMCSSMHHITNLIWHHC
jgi:hypothetical protein